MNYADLPAGVTANNTESGTVTVNGSDVPANGDPLTVATQPKPSYNVEAGGHSSKNDQEISQSSSNSTQNPSIGDNGMNRLVFGFLLGSAVILLSYPILTKKDPSVINLA